MEAVKTWFTSVVAQYLADVTPAIHNSPPLVCLAVVNVYLPNVLLQSANVLIFHQMKNEKAVSILAFLESQLHWGQALAGANISAGILVHILRSGRESVFCVVQWCVNTQ